MTDAVQSALAAAKPTLSEDDRRHLAHLLAEGTPGEWRVEQGVTHLEVKAPYQKERAIARVYCDIDAALIAALHNHVPTLLAERDRLAAELAAVREAIPDHAERILRHEESRRLLERQLAERDC